MNPRRDKGPEQRREGGDWSMDDMRKQSTPLVQGFYPQSHSAPKAKFIAKVCEEKCMRFLENLEFLRVLSFSYEL